MKVLVDNNAILKTPVVSVCLVCYNQSKYIAQAIESILMQKTDFSFEIIIADDCSTDGTCEIIKDYQFQRPEQVIIVQQETNVGLAKNWTDVMSLPRGQYIAYLEGDDFWTDPLKLQRQFEYLNSNPGYVLCFHDYLLVDEEGHILPHQTFKDHLKRDRSVSELVVGSLFHQNTMMFRKVFDHIPHQFYKAYNLDTFFIAYLSRWGGAGYIKGINPMMYRLHPKAIWSNEAYVKQQEGGIKTLQNIKEVVDVKFHDAINFKILSKRVSIIKYYYKAHRYSSLVGYTWCTFLFMIKFGVFARPKEYQH